MVAAAIAAVVFVAFALSALRRHVEPNWPAPAYVASVVLLYRIRRLPDGDDSLAYVGIVSLATRLGYGPHPSQTEYEYAGTLSETIPTVREDLFVVTDAQVQTTYGDRELDDERRGLLRGAYARIRTALLRLSLRWRR